MEDRLKERLTGAVLLVVLVVVLVPAIFRGEQPGAAGTAVNAGAQQQVYTIDLKGATAPATAAEADTDAAPTATPIADSPPVAADTASAAAVPARRADAPEVAAVTPAIQNAPAPANRPDAIARSITPARPDATGKAAAKLPAVLKPAPPAAKPSVTVAKPTVPVAAKGGFIVQVGSFSKRDNAQQMVKSAARKGVHLVVAGPDDRGNFRVRTVAVHTRQEAVALQEHLRGQGFKGLVGAAN